MTAKRVVTTCIWALLIFTAGLSLWALIAQQGYQVQLGEEIATICKERDRYRAEYLRLEEADRRHRVEIDQLKGRK